MSLRPAMQALLLSIWFMGHGGASAALGKCGEEDCPAPTQAEAFIQMHGPVSQQAKPHQTTVREDAVEEVAPLVQKFEEEEEDVEEERWNKPGEHAPTLAQVAAKKSQNPGKPVNVTFPKILPGKYWSCAKPHPEALIYSRGVVCEYNAAGPGFLIFSDVYAGAKGNGSVCIMQTGANIVKGLNRSITAECHIDNLPPQENGEQDWHGLGPILAQVSTQKTQEPVTVTFPESSEEPVCVEAKNVSCEFDAAGDDKVIYFGPNSTLCAFSLGANYGKGWNSSVSATCEKGGVPPPS